MNEYIPSLTKLIEEFDKLPTIGYKTATRLAYGVLEMSNEKAKEFCDALMAAKENIKRCKVCNTLTDTDLCFACASSKRDRSVICVVEETKDVFAIENTGEYKGLYHVLGGAISPMNSVTPDKLFIKSLISRLESDEVKEVIMATNPTIEGDTTAVYLSKLIKPLGVKVTRLAYGVPVGGELEYADEITIYRSLMGRNEL